MTTDSIGVIGSGLGGLAAACTLAGRGHKVILFDKNGWAGGKAAVLKEQGYRFDMGPTIMTVPGVLRRIFKESGRDLDDYLDLVRLDPQWRCFFDDGSVLDLEENVEQMAQRIDGFSKDGKSGDGYRKFLKLSERLHDVSDRFFFWKSVEDLKDTMDVKANMNAKTLGDVMSLRMGQTVAGTIRKVVSDERVSQLLDHFTQYVGSSPYNSPAVLCAIAHMQTELGVWYPIGGTRAVPEAMQKLAGELGVDIRLDTEVKKISHAGGKVTGVVTSKGEEIPLKVVVSNMDSVRTYNELIGGDIARSTSFEKKYEPACSGVVLYLGLKKEYEHLLHHCFVFSRDPEEEFDAIYKKGIPAPDPTCYLAATARTEKPGEVAPKGGESLYVLAHTPYLRPGQDWSKMFPDYRNVMIDKLKRTAGLTDIEDRIEFEAHLTPQDIHDRYHVLNGAIYGLASHGRFLGAFKPGNRSRQLEGLYLAGGAAHPGPGMPMVMMSGWIAADVADQDLSTTVAA